VIESALVSILSSNAGVVAALGSRIYPDQVPESTAYPFATFFRVDSSPFSGLYQDTEWERARIQFTVYEPSRKAARLAANTVKTALSRLHQTTLGVVIDDCRVLQERDSFASAPHPQGVCAVEIDFEIIYKDE
jgi:hypothetical protein